jgi:murein DD-endopeptidase MepM/ murein hydrolase activator NlpD
MPCSQRPPGQLRAFQLLAGWLLAAAVPCVHAQCLQPPVDGPFITSNFGMRFHPVQRAWRAHNGTDFRAPMFTQVRSSASGLVTYAGWMGGGGNSVFVLSDTGVQTRYLHLSRVFVQTGQAVSVGSVLGDSGNTGHSSAAPHLHFEVRKNGGSLPTDPRVFMCSRPDEKADAGPEAPTAANSFSDGGAGPKTATDGMQTVPPSAAMGSLSELSLQEFLRMEVEKRFLNPQWYRELADPADAAASNPDAPAPPAGGGSPKLFLFREIAMMLALDTYLGYEKALIRERIETLLATSAAAKTKAYHAPRLEATRSAAAATPREAR